MAEMFEAVAILGVVEPLVLDLPTTFGQVVERATAQLSAGEIGQPESFDDLTVSMVLAIAEHPHRLPTQRLPGVEVVGIPDLDAVGAVPESQVRGLSRKAALRCPVQLWQVVLEPGDGPPTQIAGPMQERRCGKLAIHHHVVGKACSQQAPSAPEEALCGGVFA